MFIKLSNRQLTLLKRLLPTCKLNAYDIQIFQEIMAALDKPIDNINSGYKSNINESVNNVNSGYKSNINESVNNIKSNTTEPIKKSVPTPKPVVQEYIESIKQDELPDDNEEIEDDEPDMEEIEDTEPASIFSVIDRRIKK